MTARFRLRRSANARRDVTSNWNRQQVSRTDVPIVEEAKPAAALLGVPAARFLRPLAWLVFAAVVLVTIVPLELRPTSFLPLKVERAMGFAALSLVFTLAYARRWKLVLLSLVLAAFGIEILQFFVPSRDPSIIDCTVKAVGAASGVLAAKLPGGILRARRPLERK